MRSDCGACTLANRLSRIEADPRHGARASGTGDFPAAGRITLARRARNADEFIVEIVWNELIAQPDPDEAPVSMQGRRPEVFAGEKNGAEVYGATPSVAERRPARTTSATCRRNSGRYGSHDLSTFGRQVKRHSAWWIPPPQRVRCPQIRINSSLLPPRLTRSCNSPQHTSTCFAPRFSACSNSSSNARPKSATVACFQIVQICGNDALSSKPVNGRAAWLENASLRTSPGCDWTGN